MSPSKEAIVICTRNRPSQLRTTLESIREAGQGVQRRLLVVDASDKAHQKENRVTVREHDRPLWTHHAYEDVPSLARQRNHALDLLPESVEIVHFVDDDVTVDEAYFDELSAVLSNEPDVSGVGGAISEPEDRRSSRIRETARRMFLLSHAEPGRVLPSGCTTHAQHPPFSDDDTLRDTEWLSGCSCSYRRSILDEHRFDEELTGYSMLEDLDLSYRISRHGRLVVQPRAKLAHRRSARNRPDVEQYSHALTVHRRWFVDKHFATVGAKLAYWWSLFGRLLALSVSGISYRDAALRGLLRGIQTVLTRSHPLLRLRS